MTRTLLLATLLAPLAATPALAQPPGGGGDWQAAMAQRRQEMQADITTVLGLRPDQQPALQTWLGSMGPRDGTAPGAREAAAQQFRAALDPRQQQVFDALERLRHDRPGGGRGRWQGGAGGDTPPPPPPGM